MFRSTCIALLSTVSMLSASAAFAASSITLTPSAENAAAISYEAGLPRFASTAPTSAVTISLMKTTLSPTRRSGYIMTVTNNGPAAVNVVPSIVSVQTDSGVRLAVLSVGDLHALADQMATSAVRKRALVQLLVGGSNTSTSTTEANISGYGPNGPSNYTATATTTVVDPAKVEANAREAAAWNMELQSATNGLHQLAERQGFRSQTVLAGSSYTTPFVVDAIPKRAKTLTLLVRIGTETHSFNLDISER